MEGPGAREEKPDAAAEAVCQDSRSASPATLPIGRLRYVSRGAFFSGSYFRRNVGGVGADVTAAPSPWPPRRFFFR